MFRQERVIISARHQRHGAGRVRVRARVPRPEWWDEHYQNTRDTMAIVKFVLEAATAMSRLCWPALGLGRTVCCVVSACLSGVFVWSRERAIRVMRVRVFQV